MEGLRAISARVRLALQRLEQGNSDGAKAVLKDLAKILPAPKKNNWKAANNGR
ncbi:MAG: hypothetical protein AB2754_16035 [Candidatus Thiodiazotropha endolucinida]